MKNQWKNAYLDVSEIVGKWMEAYKNASGSKEERRMAYENVELLLKAHRPKSLDKPRRKKAKY